jgi:hypothetical protein
VVRVISSRSTAVTLTVLGARFVPGLVVVVGFVGSGDGHGPVMVSIFGFAFWLRLPPV